MKKITFLFLFWTVSFLATAQNTIVDGISFTEASELTLFGKLMPDTPNPYHRVDTMVFKGFTKSENSQVRMSTGIAIAFKTDSPMIYVHTDYGQEYIPISSDLVAIKGYDLYIKKDGEYLYAASGLPKNELRREEPYRLIANMDGSVKECILYLPLFSEVHSVKIGVKEGSLLTAAEVPFHHRVGVFGSSFTQGAGASRPGMTYTSQLSRKIGIQFLNLGCAGNCKMQPYFADVLCSADVDAFIFDVFSNPDVATIEHRLFPFIEKIMAAHLGKPLIFLQTPYREIRNFDMTADAKERAKQEKAEELMAIACKKYKDVYFLKTNVTSEDHSTSVDGIHPDNNGYILWVESIERPVRKILKKYGIKNANSSTRVEKLRNT